MVHNHIIEDSDFSTVEQKTSRIEICKKCEYYSNTIVEECLECNCILESRISFVDMFCPKGKW